MPSKDINRSPDVGNGPRWSIPILGLFLVLLPLGRYWTLNSSLDDLGFFTNQLYMMGRDPTQWFLPFNGHLQGYMPLYALLYRCIPSPTFLLLSQSFLILLALPLLPISISQPKHVPNVLFLLCYAVWYTAYFDFHFDHLVIPITALFYRAASRKRFNLALFAALLAAPVKEPFALVTAMMGLYLVIRHRRYVRGLFVLMAGLAYFYLAVYYVIPFFRPSYLTPDQNMAFEHLGGSIPAMLLYPVLHLKEFLGLVITPGKALYLAAPIGAFGLASVFFAPLELLPALPLMLIALLSDHWSYYNIHFHYGAGLVVPFLMAYQTGWPGFTTWMSRYLPISWRYRRHPRRWAWAVLLVALASHVLLSPSPFALPFYKQHLWRNLAFWGDQADRNRRIIEVSENLIPRDPTVSVSSQSNLNFAHLAHRKYFLVFPEGVFEPLPCTQLDFQGVGNLIGRLIRGDRSLIQVREAMADYITLDLQRSLLVMGLKDGQVRQVSPAEFEQILLRVQTTYQTLYRQDGFLILKRRAMAVPIRSGTP